jgi:hypothetical protein
MVAEKREYSAVCPAVLYLEIKTIGHVKTRRFKTTSSLPCKYVRSNKARITLKIITNLQKGFDA